MNDKKVVAKASFGVLKWSSQVVECWNHTGKDAYMICKLRLLVHLLNASRLGQFEFAHMCLFCLMHGWNSKCNN